MAEIFHEPDESLELYALARLSDSDVIRIEEHLLVCDSCRDRLEQNASFAAAVSDHLKREPAPRVSAAGWGRLSLWPQFAMGGAVAIAILAVVLLWNGNARIAPLATIQLTAMRAADVQSVVQSRELDLWFADANAPPASAEARIEVVGGDGTPVWQGSPETAGSASGVRIRKVLPPGDYFVRYYVDPAHLLHEYAFAVRK